MELPVRRDGVAVLQLEPPIPDAGVQFIPPLGVHAQGGSDVAGGSLGLVDVVDSHGGLSPPSCSGVSGP